jgi:uncharacterized protein
MTLDEQILLDILNNIVTVPDQVKLDRTIDELGVLLAINVAPVDMGIVIGRSGSMSTAIKTIMKAVGKANNMIIRVMFNEPEGSTKGKPYSDNKGYYNDNAEAPLYQPTSSQASYSNTAPAQYSVPAKVDSIDDDMMTATPITIKPTVIDTDLEDLVIN